MTIAFIPLTKGRRAQVDACDQAWLQQLGRWCFSHSGYSVHYFTAADGTRKIFFMHRLIMERVMGHSIPHGMQVDHINMDRLDNTRANLRLATRSQNQAHKDVPRNNTSLYKGVSWNHGKWEARIKYGSKRIHLGRYTDAELAALAYDVASRSLYQDYAGCNFTDRFAPPHIEERVKQIVQRYRLR